MSEGVNGLKAILPTSINRGMSLFQPVPAKMRDVSSKSRVMGDYQARFRERFRGETPLYLLDFYSILSPLILLKCSLFFVFIDKL